MTHFETYPRCYWDQHSDQAKFNEYHTEDLASRAYTGFFKGMTQRPSFDLAWPIFKRIKDFIETNILTTFYEYRT